MAGRVSGPGSKLRTVTLVEEHTGVTDIFLRRSNLSLGIVSTRWVCLWVIFWIASCWRRAKPTVGSTASGHVVLDGIRKETEFEPGSKPESRLLLQFLLKNPSMVSLNDRL